MLQNFLKFPLKKKKILSSSRIPRHFPALGWPLNREWCPQSSLSQGELSSWENQIITKSFVSGSRQVHHPPLSPPCTDLHKEEKAANSWSCLCSQAPGVTHLGSCPGLQLLQPFSILVAWMPLSLPRPLGKCLTTSWKMTPCKELLQVQEEKARSPVSFLS